MCERKGQGGVCNVLLMSVIIPHSGNAKRVRLRERDKSTGVPPTEVEINNLPFLLANLSVYTGTDSACGSNRFITFASFHGEDALSALTVNLL